MKTPNKEIYTRPDGSTVSDERSIKDLWVKAHPGIPWDFDQSRTAYFYKLGTLIATFVCVVLMGVVFWVSSVYREKVTEYASSALFIVSFVVAFCLFEDRRKTTKKFRIFLCNVCRLTEELNIINPRFQPVVQANWTPRDIDAWAYTVSEAKLTNMLDDLLVLEAGALLLLEGVTGRMPDGFKDLVNRLKPLFQPFGIEEVPWRFYFQAAQEAVEKASAAR